MNKKYKVAVLSSYSVESALHTGGAQFTGIFPFYDFVAFLHLTHSPELSIVDQHLESHQEPTLDFDNLLLQA